MRVGLLIEGRNFIFTNLDLDIIDMRAYAWLDANISSFQYVDTSSYLTINLVKEWMFDEFKGNKSPLENEKTFRVNYAFNSLDLKMILLML
jgi:hypothetical protein